MPSGKGGVRVWPLTKCRSGTGIRSTRPGKACSGRTISTRLPIPNMSQVLLSLRSRHSEQPTLAVRLAIMDQFSRFLSCLGT